MTIKSLPAVDRPREKVTKYGPAKLTTAELVALILGTGRKGTNAVELAKKLLTRYKDHRITKVSVNELAAVNGLGTTKAAALVACFELGRRFTRQQSQEPLLTPGHVWNALHDIRQSKREHFVVFYLNAHNQTIHREVISVGTVNMSMVHPREVFEPAITHLATSILVAHNHPSGNPQPSTEDKEVTAQLVVAGEILGIEVIDHVIITEKGFLSLKQQGAWP